MHAGTGKDFERPAVSALKSNRPFTSESRAWAANMKVSRQNSHTGESCSQSAMQNSCAESLSTANTAWASLQLEGYWIL
jgi:hypothetical protein